jgi:hypothetical protein
MTAAEWTTVVIPGLSVLVVGATSAYTVWSANKREIEMLKKQQEHEKVMKLREESHAERTRLAAQKHAAYSELLAAIPLAAAERVKHKGDELKGVTFMGKFRPVKLEAAAAQAKLVSSQTSQNAISQAMTEFLATDYFDPQPAEDRMQEIFANELSLSVDYEHNSKLIPPRHA